MTVGRIHILDESTINQIAAGEVIENPASVVKELIENAIDANSTEIEITTQGAGHALIKVSDNGIGMGRDDLALALERHATSKLFSINCLETLNTLGFRGEALPSIASVSKLKIHSALKEGVGNLISVVGGRIEKLEPLPRRRGTTIEMRSLFFNTPVRKKFQKTPAWDKGEIYKVLTKFLLGYPSIAITWIDDHRKEFHFSHASYSEWLVLVLGREFATQALHMEHLSDTLEIRGTLGQPHLNRPNRLAQYIFINQRVIHSPWISQKVLEAYDRRLPTHRYPLFVISMKVPPRWVDVNVHPQKREVRFREEERVAHFIKVAITKSLIQKESQEIENRPSFNMMHPLELPIVDVAPLCVAEQKLVYLAETREEPSLFASKSFSVIGRVKHFFLIQESEGIRLVNMNHALERVVYDELQLKKEKVTIQTLLLPLKLSFRGKERFLLEEKLMDLNEMGIALRPFGGDTFLIDAIPAILEPSEIEDLIYAFLEEGKMPKSLGKCLKRGVLNMEMGEEILKRLFKCAHSDTTPEGKKIHFVLDEKILEKWL